MIRKNFVKWCVLGTACGWIALPAHATLCDEFEDLDGDGVSSCDDCDDTDATRYPGALEQIGDGVDQDCDGQDLCFLDEDDDGYGSSSTVVITGVDCVDAPGVADVDYDCDDQDDTIYPGADDAPADGIDSDCDGLDALDTGLTTDTDDPTETPSGRRVQVSVRGNVHDIYAWTGPYLLGAHGPDYDEFIHSQGPEGVPWQIGDLVEVTMTYRCDAIDMSAPALVDLGADTGGVVDVELNSLVDGSFVEVYGAQPGSFCPMAEGRTIGSR